MRLFQYVYIEKNKYWRKYETNNFKINTNVEKLSECYDNKHTVFFVLLLNQSVSFFWYVTQYNWYGYELEISWQHIYKIQKNTQVFKWIETK